jgi:predicted DNA-binding transcriptional regulator AlpA
MESEVDRIRSRKQVAEQLGISTRTLDRLQERGELPPRVKISNRLVGYRASEIERYLQSRTQSVA